jgi:N-acyl-D-amino-acid deacylase
VVTPGFIDIHTHSDFTLPLNPRAESKIRQGVTTEVVGNCGFSVAPALPGRAGVLRDYLAASAPWLEFQETTFAAYLSIGSSNGIFAPPSSPTPPPAAAPRLRR